MLLLVTSLIMDPLDLVSVITPKFHSTWRGSFAVEAPNLVTGALIYLKYSNLGSSQRERQVLDRPWCRASNFVHGQVYRPGPELGSRSLRVPILFPPPQ